jgi:hypothetical protein
LTGDEILETRAAGFSKKTSAEGWQGRSRQNKIIARKAGDQD